MSSIQSAFFVQPVIGDPQGFDLGRCQIGRDVDRHFREA